MELGISTFGEVQPEGVSGVALSSHRRMQELLAEARLAEEVGLHVFAVGEHHRPDFIVSAPEVVLGAIAAGTRNIRLSSSVTVLSSADPVRVFQNFATLDLVSGGRAEIIAGRGSFTESFPLFGHDLKDYDELFIEKLDLLMLINRQEVITWKGRHRPPVQRLGIYPRPYQPALPIWLGVGGTPSSAGRAGRLNLPMTLAILGGRPVQFVPLVHLYRQSARDAGHDPAALPLAINSQLHIAEDSRQAADDFYPTYERLMNRVGKERGWSPITRHHFETLREPDGPLFVGSVEEVAEKIIYQHRLFGHTRFLGQIIKGDIPHEKILRSIELLGTKVAPLVRQELASVVRDSGT
ncbi:MAG TPA: Atu2307/SP_0267 family LLM class monooxygenase [Puia sp.]|jgi:probable LLM family oxidoreductase|nr:Atu2307/SP_0267 family LLM class monooxygenase [Puia sp.]